MAAQKFLNPLTVEAHIFLQQLKSYEDNSVIIDPVLCETLEKVLVGIENFLGKSNQIIVNTEHTSCVSNNELDSIQRFYHCSTCRKDLGKTPDKVAIHLAHGHENYTVNEKRREIKKAEREKKKQNIVLVLPKKAKKLISNDLIDYFADSIKIAEKLKHIPEYDKIESELMKLITPLFPNLSVKLYKFGSRMTGIGALYSDLDVFVDIGNSFEKFENRASDRTVSNLKKVANAMKKNSKDWKHLVVIDHARVPILKVKNAQTGIECDIGFSNSLGFCNTKLVQYIFELQPIVRRMCVFLKKWLERTKLSDHISTYGATLMVIYYMQLEGHLPSIAMLQTNMENHVLVGPWISNYKSLTLEDLKKPKVEITPKQCKMFLQDFCKFYGQFAFEKYVVCPYLGSMVTNNEIEKLMPSSYRDYIENSKSTKDVALQLNKLMVVQDPIQLNHNVTKSVPPTTFKKFTEFLEQTAGLFDEIK